MGAISFSVDVELARLFCDALDMSVFIETGTFKGDTIALVKDLFENVYSCECSYELAEVARKRFESDSKIRVLNGSSPKLLLELPIDKENENILYWLDAHWCAGGGKSDGSSECPLIEELDAIQTLNENSIVWIDDARYFLAPPPDPMESSDWPTCFEVLERLRLLAPDTHRYMILNDTILYFPNRITGELTEYARKNGVDWLMYAHVNQVVVPELKAAIIAKQRSGFFARMVTKIRKKASFVIF